MRTHRLRTHYNYVLEGYLLAPTGEIIEEELYYREVLKAIYQYRLECTCYGFIDLQALFFDTSRCLH